MKICKLNGREVNLETLAVEIDGDYPDFEDSYFCEGEYADGEELSLDDLSELSDQECDLLYGMVWDRYF